jgi:tetratricopeptide (TPR) repeat protein
MIRLRVFRIAILFFLALGLVAIINFWRSKEYFMMGQKYLKAQAYTQAILSFEQVLLNDLPGKPFKKQSINYLFDIGALALEKDDRPTALQAYHAILFANASLSVYRSQPQGEALKALKKIREIDPTMVGDREPKYFPDRTWSLILGLSLLVWIGAIFFFLSQGIDRQGKIYRSRLVLTTSLFIAAFVVWLVSIKNL